MMTVVAAAIMTVQSVGVAAAAPAAAGVASNRAALGMPVGTAAGRCTTVNGRASCTGEGASKIGGEGVIIALLAAVAIGAGIAAGVSNDTTPNSP